MTHKLRTASVDYILSFYCVHVKFVLLHLVSVKNFKDILKLLKQHKTKCRNVKTFLISFYVTFLL